MVFALRLGEFGGVDGELGVLAFAEGSYGILLVVLV